MTTRTRRLPAVLVLALLTSAACSDTSPLLLDDLTDARVVAQEIVDEVLVVVDAPGPAPEFRAGAVEPCGSIGPNEPTTERYVLDLSISFAEAEVMERFERVRDAFEGVHVPDGRRFHLARRNGVSVTVTALPTQTRLAVSAVSGCAPMADG